MIERLWRCDALRVHLLSHIGVVVTSAVLLVAGQPATAQYVSDFEAPLYEGSAMGTIITGQDEFYIPVVDSQDGLVYTYAGNALGIPMNPSGGGEQFAGVTGGDVGLPVPFARAQRDVVYGDGTGVWTVTFDIAATFLGDGGSAQNIGSFSTQLFDAEATLIALATWTDEADPTAWNAGYVWYNAQGTQINEAVDNPAFQELDTEHWYRWSTTFNLDTNQIAEVSITDLTTNITVTHSPVGRFLVGGSAGGKAPPSGFRLFAGSGAVAGNTLAFDNVDVDLASGTPSGSCCFEDETCEFLTQEACEAGGGTYQGDWTACTLKGCITIPKQCGEGAGACGKANGSPGCDDELCCALVCLNFDPGCCEAEWDDFCAAAAIKLGCANPSVATCDPEGTAVFDNIGPDAGSLVAGAFACQRFPDLKDSDIVALDDFTVGGGGFIPTCMDVSARFFTAGNTDWNLVESWSVEFYSSPEAAGANLTGDVASLILPAPLVEPFGDDDILRFDLTGGPGPAIELAPGTYWVGVIPTMPFGGGAPGQIGLAPTSIGNDNAYHANPGGFFGFPDGFQQIAGGVNLAYRVVGTELKGGCPWDLDGSGSVGAADLLDLLFNWGPCPGCAADFDGDDIVGASDLLAMLFNWGPCP